MASEPVSGHLFDGRSTRPHTVEVSLEMDELVITGTDRVSRWPVMKVHLEPRLGSTQRRIDLPDGTLVEVADSPLWDLLTKRQGRSQDWLARLESRWIHALVALVGVAAACWAFYQWGLPRCADLVAQAVPPAWVNKLGESTLGMLDHGFLAPSKLPPARRQQLVEAFAGWQSGEADAPHYRIVFRAGKSFHANALALPSGEIVVTDELVALAKDDRELLGVLAHELGHLHHRHAIRHVVRGAFVTVAAAIWFGDVGDLGGLSSALLNLDYSREFERDADDYAAGMMRANHVSPAHLADILGRLDPEHAAESGLSSYLRTHPDTRQRIERLRRQATGL